MRTLLLTTCLAVLLPLAALADTISMSWADLSNNEDGFIIERRLSPTGAYGELARTGPNAMTYTDATVPAAGVACYRIASFNRAGQSAGYTNEACGDTVTIPADPGSLKITTKTEITISTTDAEKAPKLVP